MPNKKPIGTVKALRLQVQDLKGEIQALKEAWADKNSELIEAEKRIEDYKKLIAVVEEKYNIVLK